MKNSAQIVGCFLLAVAVGGCDSVKKSILGAKTPPDEFAVFSRAPLSIPPDYGLSPPEPGKSRPQEITPRKQAEKAIIGGRRAGGAAASGRTPPVTASRGVQAILRDTGSLQAGSDIRKTINRDVTAPGQGDKKLTDKLMFWKDGPQEDVVVDPAREARRIRDAKSKGQKVTGENSAVISRKNDPNRGLLDKLLFE